MAQGTNNTYDGELDVRRAVFRAPLIDILNPLLVIRKAVGGDTDELYATLLKVGRPGEPPQQA